MAAESRYVSNETYEKLHSWRCTDAELAEYYRLAMESAMGHLEETKRSGDRGSLQRGMDVIEDALATKQIRKPSPEMEVVRQWISDRSDTDDDSNGRPKPNMAMELWGELEMRGFHG